MADIIKKEDQESLVALANLLSKSQMIPEHFKNRPADCAFAADLARSVDLPTVEVMRALYPSKGGKWGWSTEFMVAQLLRSGLIKGTLHYESKGSGLEYSSRCWAIDAATGERMNGPWITPELIKAQGWDTPPRPGKQASKWFSMREEMTDKRSATWFTRKYYPSALMGHRPAEELDDIARADDRERDNAQSQAEARYSPAPKEEPRVVEAEPIPAEVEFTDCQECEGDGCVLCEGTGKVPI